MPLIRILLVGICLVLFGSLFPTPGQAQESYDTDRVVMFDTSMSMNRPYPDPLLPIVKTVVREMVANDWLRHSQNQTEPSKLYFYPFDQEPHPRREYDLTPQGVRAFDQYVTGLPADGSYTGIIGTLRDVLEAVPNLANQDGREVQRQYILLTDGDENVESVALINEEALYKLLIKWGKTLGVTKYGDSCFILRLGKPNGVVWKAIERQVKKAKAAGVPVDIGWVLPNPAAIRKMLQPPSCTIAPEIANISIATKGKPGQGTCTFNITGSHLPAKIPAGLIIEAKWVDGAPEFTSLNPNQSAVTAQEWLSLVNGQIISKEISIDFAPPAGRDVADVGQLRASWVDPAGKLTMESRLVTVSVTSKGKVEVAVSANKIRIPADRIDNRASTHILTLGLNADPAVLQNAGKVLIHTEDSWPNDDPVLLIDGQPLVVGQPLDLTKNQHKISIQLDETKGFTTYGGDLVLKSIDCQLRSGAAVSTTLRIPWVLEGEPIPPALVTLAGQLPINGMLEITVQRTQPGQVVKIRKQIAFPLQGAAGKQAKAAGFTISAKDREPAIDKDNPGNRIARDPAMTVQFDGKEREIGPLPGLDAITLDIVIPGSAPAGEYRGVAELRVNRAKFTAPGLGAPQTDVDLFWAVIVLPPPVATVTLKAPTFLQLNNLVNPGAPWNPNQNIASIPIELEFNAEAKRVNLQVTVSGGVDELVFSPDNPIGVVKVEIPKGQIEKQALIRLKANATTAQFAATENNFQTFTVKAHIVGMPQPLATLHRTEEQESTVFENAERGDVASYSIPVSWNDAAQWMGSRIQVIEPANVDLAGRDLHVTIETERGFIGPDTTEIVVLTRLSESTEPDTFSETWEFVGEGNLLVEPNEIVFTQRLLTPPMPMWKKLAYAAAAMVVLLLVGLLVNQQVKKHHGPPTFPVSFSCEWETRDDGDSGYIKATGKEEHTFGSGTDELETLPITVTLKATKQQYGCGLTINWEVTEQSSDGQITCVRFDDMNTEKTFHDGESVSSSDRIVFKENDIDFLELNFHGIADGGLGGDEGEFGGEDDDDGGDFDFEDEKEFTV